MIREGSSCGGRYSSLDEGRVRRSWCRNPGPCEGPKRIQNSTRGEVPSPVFENSVMQERVYEPVSYKQLKDLMEAVKTYGVTATYTTALLRRLTVNAMTPTDCSKNESEMMGKYLAGEWKQEAKKLIRTGLRLMRGTNQSNVLEFLLLELSRQPQQQQLLFLLFLIMYLATVLGNLLIILAIGTDSCLHTPMYFFLSNLSFVDVCFSSTIVPKVLTNHILGNQHISFSGCLTQLYFLCVFADMDNFLLAVMAYDSWSDMATAMMYTVVTPMLNPFIYSLRNKDMKGALRKVLTMKFSSTQ
ncbi:hypothetical protein STEG23_000180 [Scotinomys teguina]